MTSKRFKKLLMSIGVPRDAAGEVAAIVPRHLSASGVSYENFWLLYMDALRDEDSRATIAISFACLNSRGELDKFYRFAAKFIEANKIARTEPGRKKEYEKYD